jgi:hypothetical protein
VYKIRFLLSGSEYQAQNYNFTANQPYSFPISVVNQGQYTIKVEGVNILASCEGNFQVTAAPGGPGASGNPFNVSPKDWLLSFDPGLGIPVAKNGFLSGQIIPFAISLLIFLVVLLSLIFTIVGGIMYMTSGGNKEGAAKAKNTITYALVGLAVGLGAFLISKILFTFLGM